MKRCACAVWRCAALVVLGVVLSAQPAAAQTKAGIRAGVSGDPSQFYFGGHVETEPVADRLRFRPNVEIGVGNGTTLIGFNVEFAYHFERPPRRAWNIYTGGGPALNIIDTPRNTDAGGGFNMLVGAARDSGLFVEFKVGVLDSPGVKLGVGYTFR